jgi:O-antigen/teichoic acid export membrane protein
MTSQATEAPSHTPKPHAQFFRQSGWLMFANIAGGLMTFGLHPLSNRIAAADYTVFGTLLMVTAVLPTMPLQMIFAQQTAVALATGRDRQVASMIRLAWLWLFLLWLVATVAILIFQKPIIARWQLGSAMPLWITLGTILLSLWVPMFSGVLQGKQDFFWIGWSSILGGASRLGFSALFVLALGAGATGMVTGPLVGSAITAIIAIWFTRDLWVLPRERFDGRGLLRQVMPLIFGFGACQFMFTADTLIAKAFFSDDEMAPYIAAGTLSRALLWIVMPLATVMFPKIVHSSAKSEKTNLLQIVLLGTAVLGFSGGIGLWLVGPFVVRSFHFFPASYVQPMSLLLPWYAAAMVPLALANVLANDLLARKEFRVVPGMFAVAVLYGVALLYVLNHFPKKLEHVLQTLAVFNFLLLCVCAWAAFFVRPKSEIRSAKS